MAGNIFKGLVRMIMKLVKGLLWAVVVLLKFVAECLKIFLLLFSLVARIVLSVAGIALKN